MVTKLFAFQNKAAEAMPPFGIGRLKSVLTLSSASGEPVYELVKPDTESNGVFVVNGAASVPVNGFGSGVMLDDATVVLIDEAAVPAFGAICGPVNAKWSAATTGTGLRALGAAANKLVPVMGLGGGSGSSSGSSGSCNCACIDTGDIYVNGVLTSSKFSVTFSKVQKRKQANGWIEFPAGTYIVTWSSSRGLWFVDVGSYLVAYYWDGTSATSATTMDAEITMEWSALGARPKVKLCITGTVPPKP